MPKLLVFVHWRLMLNLLTLPQGLLAERNRMTYAVHTCVAPSRNSWDSRMGSKGHNRTWAEVTLTVKPVLVAYAPPGDSPAPTIYLSHLPSQAINITQSPPRSTVSYQLRYLYGRRSTSASSNAHIKIISQHFLAPVSFLIYIFSLHWRFEGLKKTTLPRES